MKERSTLKMTTLADFLHIRRKDEGTDDKKEGKIFTVKEITQYIKRKFIEDDTLSNVYVRGEISNFKRTSVGHIYFTLKDKFAEIKCVMFRGDNASLEFQLKDGMGVVVRGSVGVYEKGGVYELYVKEIRKEGLGDLFIEFERLKAALREEGLFEEAYKRAIPRYPERIGIITSPTGAAIRDMLRIIRKRFPCARILFKGVTVQGDEAPHEIVKAIEMMNRVSKAGIRIDVIILGRGGGSIEELWAFNEEIVARAIFKSDIPIISAVGHEIDFTISDFVADKRAATPSEAAEIVVPDRNELRKTLDSFLHRMKQAISGNIDLYRKRMENIEKSTVFRRPTEGIKQLRQQIDDLNRRLSRNFSYYINMRKNSLEGVYGKLKVLNPISMIGRGYSMCLDREGNVIRSIEDADVGDEIRILLKDGELYSKVIERRSTDGG